MYLSMQYAETKLVGYRNTDDSCDRIRVAIGVRSQVENIIKNIPSTFNKQKKYKHTSTIRLSSSVA